MENQLGEQLIIKLNYLDETKDIIADAIVQAGASITSKMTFRDYAKVISKLSTGEVLLFNTKSEMDVYDRAKKDDLAIIYRENIEKVEAGDRVRYLIFPDNVTTNIEITTNYNIDIYRAPSDNELSKYGSFILTSSYAEFILGTNGNDCYVTYVSEDGINYSRVTSVTNPYDIEQYIYIPSQFYYSNIVSEFFKTVWCEFEGIYKYNGNNWLLVPTQFTAENTNQLLTDISAYGTNGLITGDGTYISNIKISEYIAKYLPSLQNNTTKFDVIQYGTKVKPMEFVQREQISTSIAFSETSNTDCIVQTTDCSSVSVNTAEYATFINNYLNCSVKQNYSFFINDKAYRLYLGYNYNTIEQYNDFTGNNQTVPYQMTSLYAFIINLEDLSIYKTFQNNDTWSFVNNGSGGNILTYAYSVASDCLVLISDMNGWLRTDGASIGRTIIQSSGTRTTSYYTVNFSGDYNYKSFTQSSYDDVNDCYYLAYRTSSGSQASTKRICKLDMDGNLTSIFTSNSDMKNIGVLWTSYFKNVGSLLFYTSDDTNILYNLSTGNSITLYGSEINGSTYFGIDNDNLYVSHKLSDSATTYDLYAINKKSLNATKIYDLHSDNRLYDCFYTYNRALAIFYNNTIISTEGEVLNHFVKSYLTNPSISGIDYTDDYGFTSSFMDYDLNISTDKITALFPVYKYFRYANITKLPVECNLCIVANNKTSTATNNSSSLYKYQSLVLTDVEFNEMDEAIASTERILGNSDPSDTAKYIKSLQDLVDDALELTNEIKGLI